MVCNEMCLCQLLSATITRITRFLLSSPLCSSCDSNTRWLRQCPQRPPLEPQDLLSSHTGTEVHLYYWERMKDGILLAFGSTDSDQTETKNAHSCDVVTTVITCRGFTFCSSSSRFSKWLGNTFHCPLSFGTKL